MTDLPQVYWYVIVYFGNLMGIILFLSTVLGGLYYLIKAFKGIIIAVFGVDNGKMTKDYD